MVLLDPLTQTLLPDLHSSIAKGPAKKKAAPKVQSKLTGRGASSRTAAKAATSKMQEVRDSSVHEQEG